MPRSISVRLAVGSGLAATAVLVAVACDSSMSNNTAPDAAAPSTSSSSSSRGSSSGSMFDAQAPGFDSGSFTCTGATPTTSPDVPLLTVPTGITPASGFVIEAIAKLPAPRHIAALPNGDLLVGTLGTDVYLVPHADSAAAGTPSVFTTINDAPLHGVAFHQPSCSVYFGSSHGVYRAPYGDAQVTATVGDPITKVRQLTSGGAHVSTSVALSGGSLFVSVGSSCNACVETDPTRASIEMMAPDGTGVVTYAKRIRNAVALAVNPATGTVWAGGAGQDDLPDGHPFEYFDSLTLHAAGADYGWPDCEENNHAYTAGVDCSNTVAPVSALPAFSTILGAAFYPVTTTGKYAFPTMYRGGVLLAAHGSWHMIGDQFESPPRVAFVAMNGDTPATVIDWTNATTQWTDLVNGFQSTDATLRLGRPSGIAVGRDGSVFISDDMNGLVYRVRPAS